MLEEAANQGQATVPWWPQFRSVTLQGGERSSYPRPKLWSSAGRHLVLFTHDILSPRVSVPPVSGPDLASFWLPDASAEKAAPECQ